MTVLTPILPGRDVALRDLLRSIGDDIKGTRSPAVPGHPRIDFMNSRHIHFARFAVIDDPDRGPGLSRLLYAAVYDGTLGEHLAELASITSNLDGIWGQCEGYSGVEDFPAFVSAHAHEHAAYYIAFRRQTVDTIRHAIAIRQQGTSINRPSVLRQLAGDIADKIKRVVRAAPLPVDVIRAVTRFGFSNVYHGTSRITATLDRYAVFRFTNWITDNQMPARTSPFSSVSLDNCSAPAPLAPGDEVPSVLGDMSAGFREDVITQNQLTLVTVIENGRADRVRAVMSAIDSYARRLAPSGSLIGISTIHFVRWLVIDDGRRLMMLSDYDNSWENYIDEFAEMILSGLDAIWETSRGFPPDGARDLPAFKRFLRWHQIPSDVYFSAYPDETVLNIVADTARARYA